MRDDIAKLVIIGEVEVPSQNIIINGEKYQQHTRVLCIACPKCSNVIYQYPQGASRLEVCKHISSNKEDFTKVFRYCSQCGQKLSFDSFDIVEERNG